LYLLVSQKCFFLKKKEKKRKETCTLHKFPHISDNDRTLWWWRMPACYHGVERTWNWVLCVRCLHPNIGQVEYFSWICSPLLRPTNLSTK